MKSKSKAYWVLFSITVLLFAVMLIIWPAIVNLSVHDRFPNQNCSSRMEKLSYAMLAYIHDHHNRLAMPNTTNPLTTHSWINIVLPYLYNKDIQPSAVLYCPEDHDRHKASSYLVPTELYGMTLEEIYQKPNRIIFIDDELRHTTESEPHSLRAKDLVRLDRELTKK